MGIIINLDVVMAQRKKGLTELSKEVDITMANLSILKNNNIRLSEKTFYVDTEYTLLPIKYVKNYVYYNLDI